MWDNEDEGKKARRRSSERVRAVDGAMFRERKRVYEIESCWPMMYVASNCSFPSFYSITVFFFTILERDP